MNEPAINCENLSQMDDTHKIRLLKAFVAASMPAEQLLKMMVSIVVRR